MRKALICVPILVLMHTAGCDRADAPQGASSPSTQPQSLDAQAPATPAATAQALIDAADRIEPYNRPVSDGLRRISQEVSEAGLKILDAKPFVLDATLTDDEFIGGADLMRVHFIDTKRRIERVSVEDAAGRVLASGESGAMRIASRDPITGELALLAYYVYVAPGAFDKVQGNDPKALPVPPGTSTVDRFPVFRFDADLKSQLFVRIDPTQERVPLRIFDEQAAHPTTVPAARLRKS